MAEPIDPITFELFKNAIFSIADEMALTVFRTTYSGVLKDNMDYSTGFADGDGKLVAQGLTLPGHLGSVPTAMEAIMRHYRDDMVEGDVFIMNDPFDGGMHLPDIFVFKPLYHQGKRLAFACTVCHHTDVGGRVAGSNASDSTEIYAEGLRIAPLKLYEAGKLNKTIMTFIEKNVRLPVKVFGDLRAQLAACHIAEEQFAALVAKYGPEQIAAFMRGTVDREQARAAAHKLRADHYATAASAAIYRLAANRNNPDNLAALALLSGICTADAAGFHFQHRFGVFDRLLEDLERVVLRALADLVHRTVEDALGNSLLAVPHH